MSLTLDHPGAAAVAEPQESAPEVQPYDILADQKAVVRSLADSQVIDDLTSTIDISDMSTIVTFGSKAAEDISKASDTVLKSMNMRQLDDSGTILQDLAKIMKQFDIDEIQKEPGFFGKLFGNAREQLDRILDKYHTMGYEVDKIYVQLKQYESEIKQSNRELEAMFQANVRYFHELEKYIVAGDQGCKEIRDYIAQFREELDRTGDQSINFQLQTLNQALTMLEQRTQDLRTAEVVALQSIPMIRMIEFNNMNLVQKINSAFIVTLPVFKQALAQAIMLKRQKIQTDAISALERRTGEMLKQNARIASEQARATARLTEGNAIGGDTLQDSWHTIVSGIRETRDIQARAQAERDRDREKLEAIKRNYFEHNQAQRQNT